MKRSTLDAWAAKFMGESQADELVASQWYTGSPAAAFAVLNKCCDEGCGIELRVANGKAEVECGTSETKGDAGNLASLIVEACYHCHNGGGMQESDDDGSDS